MISNNKEVMYNIRHPTDQHIQIGDSGLIRVEAIGDVNLVFHQLDEHGNPEDVVACVQDVIYTPWLGYNLLHLEGRAQSLLFRKPNWYTIGEAPFYSGIGKRFFLRHPTPPSNAS